MRASAVLALVLTLSGVARADQGDSSWSASAGYALVAIDTREASGAGVAVDYQRGINAALSWRVAGDYSAHLATATSAGPHPSGLVQAAGAVVGLSYAFDYLQIVPYGDVGIGAMYLAGGKSGVKSGPRGTLEVGVGADVLESRTFSWGVVLHLTTFLPDAGSAPVYIYGGPRLTWRWNRF